MIKRKLTEAQKAAIKEKHLKDLDKAMDDRPQRILADAEALAKIDPQIQADILQRVFEATLNAKQAVDQDIRKASLEGTRTPRIDVKAGETPEMVQLVVRHAFDLIQNDICLREVNSTNKDFSGTQQRIAEIKDRIDGFRDMEAKNGHTSFVGQTINMESGFLAKEQASLAATSRWRIKCMEELLLPEVKVSLAGPATAIITYQEDPKSSPNWYSEHLETMRKGAEKRLVQLGSAPAAKYDKQ